MTDAPPPGPPPATSPVASAPSSTLGDPAGATFDDPGAPGYRPAGRGPGGAARGRPRRPRNRWRAAFFALAGVAVVVAVTWALLGDRVFVVRSVSVTGAHLTTPAEVIATADIRLGTPLLSVDAGAATRRVEALNVVASATVTEDWPDHVVIAVTERVPVMAVRMATGGYDLVDPTGVVVRYAKDKPASLPVLVTPLPGGSLPGAPTVTTAADVLGEVQPWLSKQVAKVTTTAIPAGPLQVTLHLRDGKTVEWGSTDNAAQKNRELAILLPGDVHDVNVSAPATVVTK
jgi:cell division protein FtsQ